MTKYGNAILNIINNTTAHPTAEQIFFKLREQYPKVVMATVYNNLNALYHDHMIRKLTIENQSDRYDKNTRHDHMVCRSCGKVSDFFMRDLTDEIKNETGTDPDGYELIVYYTCEDCKKKMC